MLLQLAEHHRTRFVTLALLAGLVLAGPRALTPAGADAYETAPDSVILPPLSAEAEAAIKRAFVERNPRVAWDPETLNVDPYGTQRVIWASGRLSAPAPGPRDPVREAAAAREFARRNADLLGIAAEAVASLSVRVQDRSRLMSLVSDGPLPYPGYEHLVAFGYRVDLRLVVDGETVTFVNNRTHRLPEFGRLNTTPSIEPDSPVILSQMIGLSLVADAGDDQMVIGPVEQGDLGPPLLTIAAHELEGRAQWIGLAWRYEVGRGGLPWAFIFDAHTGDLIDIEQEFGFNT
jgi:hypothetical protein